MRDRILLAIVLGFVAGIFFRSFWNLGPAFAVFIMLIAGAAYQVFSVRSGRTSGAVVLIFTLAAGLGILRFDLSELHRNVPIMDRHLNERVALIGVVSDEPDEREDSVRLTIAVGSLLESGQKTSVSAKVLLLTDLYPKFSYGDRIEFSGKLAKPKNFVDPNGKVFDYESYLAKEGIYYQMTRPSVKLVAHGEGNKVISTLFEFKNAFLSRVSSLIPEPHASLLGGLVVGAKHSLGKKLLDDFRTAGVIHIVVLSGYNITIIAYFIEWLFSRLRKNLRLMVASVGVTLFALMVGASATVVRATIMALLVLLAKATGRIYAVTRALLIAGFLMLLHNPHILVFDTSFQLSFLATVGLIYVSPLIEPHVKWVTERWKMREIVVATLATQVFVLPFLLYKTGVLSIVALPVNLLVLSAIPATMLTGFLAGMVAFLSNTLAFPIAFAAYLLLDYELKIVEFFSHLPFAAVTITSFPLGLMILWYGAYFALFLKFSSITSQLRLAKKSSM